MEIQTLKTGAIQENTYLIYNKAEEIAVIDPGENVLDQLEKIAAYDPKKVKMIFLTHTHYDHMLGLAELHAQTKAKVYVGEEELHIVREGSENPPFLIQKAIAGGIKEALPTKDGDEFSLGEVNIKAIAAPGHTQGGRCYLIEDQLFSGDTLFAGGIGRSDFPGGDGRALVEAIRERILTLPGDTVIYSGHGPETTIAAELSTNPFVGG